MNSLLNKEWWEKSTRHSCMYLEHVRIMPFDEAKYLQREVERVNVGEALHIIKVVIPVIPSSTRVRVKSVQVCLLTDLHREECGEEAAHWLPIVIRVTLRLEQEFELHPRLVRDVAERRVEK